MIDKGKNLKVGYIAKMFPRLSETFVLNEILELERQGAEVVVFSAKKPNEGQFHPQLAQLKARIYYLEDLDTKKWAGWVSKEWDSHAPHADRIWNLVCRALADGEPQRVDKVWHAAWIASRAAELGLDRLHAHFATLPAMLAHLTHRISGIPYSFTAHAKDIFVYSPEETCLGELIEHSDFMVTVTNFNRRHLINLLPGLDPTKIKVIHNGIDLSNFQTPAFEQRQENQILAVGRLVPKKGFSDLLKACTILRERGTEFICTIAGAGVQEQALHQECRELGLTGLVEFTGPVKVDRVRDMMRTSSVFALPCCVATDNNVDALPTVLLESLASGLPAVSTQLSGIPEIITHDQEGLLVNPDSPEELADALEKMLSQRELRQQISKQGRKKAEAAFDIQKNVGQLYDLFRTDGLGSTGEASSPIEKTTRARRLLYVCTDRGIPFGGTKGAAVHMREFLGALTAESVPPLAAVRRLAKSRRGIAGYPVHVLAPDQAEPSLGTAAARENWEFSLNSGFAAQLAELHRTVPMAAVYERYSLFGTAGWEFASRHGLPFVLEVNAPLVEEAKAYRGLIQETLALEIATHLFASADHVMAVSQAVKDYILDLAPTARVTVLPNGVDTDRIRPIPPSRLWRERATGGRADSYVLGFVGRVRPWHGVDLLLDAMAEARKDDPNLRLMVVGDHRSMEGDLVDRARRLGLEDSVVFCGAVDPQDVPEALSAMDAVVAPYPHLEKFYFSPLKVFEYMAAGKPIIASAIGQIPEILDHERTGLLVPASDTSALALALLRLRRNPDLAAALARNARIEAEAKHTWRDRVRTVTGIIQSLTQSKVTA